MAKKRAKKRLPPEFDRADDDRNQVALDARGRPLPYKPEEVREIVRHAMAKGTLIAAILRGPNGELAVPVVGEPCEELVDALRAVADSYAAFVKGH